tara:strand:+ start:670 stop:1146 length:477 start_codon:yes stop_codon:yes gene_type:complete
MSSKKQREEIYLLSLDTFMILAISGICIGIIFIVFNSQVGRVKPPPPPPEFLICEESVFFDFIEDLETQYGDNEDFEFEGNDYLLVKGYNEAELEFSYMKDKLGFTLMYESYTSNESCDYPKNGKGCLNKIEDFLIRSNKSYLRDTYSEKLKKECISD